MATMSSVSTTFTSRSIELSVPAREQAEGKGARVRRSIGGGTLRNLDPFLMLDHFTVGNGGGFPSHPHRGMSTCTYMLPISDALPENGSIMHEDSAGHSGTIGAGDVQWMVAGRGIVHAEMPGSRVPAQGLQLWVNLPQKHKKDAPTYQELLSADIPKAEKDGVSVAVIAGEALGVSAKIFTKTPTHYLHYTLAPGAKVDHHVPAGWNGFLYTIRGGGWVGPGAADRAGPLRGAFTTLVFSKPSASEGTDGVSVMAGDEGFDFVLIAGEPINEPIVQYGPFVMGSMPEIAQAFDDYRNGVNGFENAPGWSAKIDSRSY